MTFPGSNLLARAQRLIAPQNFNYVPYAARTKNPVGQWLATYGTPVPMQGSVQPVPRMLYREYGLDFQKNYFIFYVSQNVVDIERDVAGDKMVWAGKTYQCESKTDWFPIDGWDGVLCVEVPA